ncbi:MAG: ppnK [Gemmatimonadetes bacterium]|nr:ppnK [Gemmatimonadota bacterium]
MIRLGVVGHLGYEGLPEVLATLRRLAPILALDLYYEETIVAHAGDGARPILPGEVDAMLTLGGDGTLLRAARIIGNDSLPILGINLGRLGFLTCAPADGLEPALRRFAADDYVVEPRMTLDARVLDHRNRERARWRALNDVVLHKGGFARVVTVSVRANGQTVAHYAADGIVLATPTGSTAYNLSAGGPVVYPTLETILITPVSAHSLALRPLVLPPSTEVTLRVEDGPEELLVTVDGQVGATFTKGETLMVSRSPHPVPIVRFPEGSFFATMREKLQWGGLLDRDERQRC